MKLLDQLERGRLWLAGESGWDLHYALFSRSGFGPELEDLAAQEREIYIFTSGRRWWVLAGRGDYSRLTLSQTEFL